MVRHQPPSEVGVLKAEITKFLCVQHLTVFQQADGCTGCQVSTFSVWLFTLTAVMEEW